jgi:hypothetical protein
MLAQQHGLRLDEASLDIQNAAMALLQASMSKEGYEKAKGCMW